MIATAPNTMHLKVLLSTEVLVDEPVVKLIAEAPDGYFCLLPRHRDFVAPLVPGVLAYFLEPMGERFVAVDEGILVKYARTVMVSAYGGVCGDSLERLQELVTTAFVQLDEHERKARTALSRLEAGTLRKFKELQDVMHG
jgi:F-type H+-transporting ATPase subunit epsilon